MFRCGIACDGVLAKIHGAAVLTEIIIISDGPLSRESPVRKLPFFFPARLIDMARLSPKTVGSASVAVVEMLDATDIGLAALKASWSSIARIPVLCLVSKSSRKENIQAAALGKSEILDRDMPLSLLLRNIKRFVTIDPLSTMPADTPAKVKEGVSKASFFLENLCLSAVTDTVVPVKAMEDSAMQMLSALDLDGLNDWLTAVNHHHSATYGHTLRVAGFAGAFARHLGWSDSDCREVVAGGLIHDIGKMRIPLSILDKAGPLTDDEKSLIRKHPLFGQEILKPRLEVPVEIKKMAIQHHEYLDGSGYPNGLKGDRITPKVRLMTICDIFVALTEDRAYRKGLAVRGALSKMRDMGAKLDQEMLQRFAGMVLERDFGELIRSAADAGGGAAA